MKKINLDRNFTKYVGSKANAVKLVNKIIEKYDDKIYRSTHRKVGRLLLEVYGETKNLKWRYNPEYKTVTVTYTDGRPDPEKTPEPRNSYYIIWIEGLSARRGEKIKKFRPDGTIEYTLKNTEAMRVLPKDVPTMRKRIRELGVADWVVDSGNTFVKTFYAPKGTLFKF